MSEQPRPPITHYENFYCSRAKRMKASEIREILKLVQRPEVISFAGGLPNPQAFPVDLIREIVNDVLDKESERACQYGSTEGVPELREAIAHRLKSKLDIDGDKDNIVVTVGSQQGLDLLGRILIGSRSHIIMESPTYLGALSAFHTYSPTFHTVKLDEHGMDVDDLEGNLESMTKHGLNIKFVYTVPTFHNPAGVTMSLKRRKKLLDLAHEHDFLIIEDDPYSELRYSGEQVPAIKSLDNEERVLYLGTLSKTLVPGFRVAWTQGPKEVIRKMVVAKQAVDLCTPPFTQRIAKEYLIRGYIDEHLKKIIKLYGQKQRIMVEEMEKNMPKEYISWWVPEGGMFLWATLMKEIDTAEMFHDAIAENVAYVTGHSFFVEEVTNCMRLNFTHPTDGRIVEGVERLARVVEKWGKEKSKEKDKVVKEVITGV